MPRKLSAIEIAEGALLADVAVVFQLLVTYLPVGKTLFMLLVPIVFTILVLRRNLRIGIMGLCVAASIVALMTGISSIIVMLIEGMAGLFLGVTMKYRLPHLLLLFLGITSGTLTVYSLLLLFTLLSGLPFSDLILSLHHSYLSLVNLLSFVTAHIGLANWWKHAAYPLISAIAQVAFTYWWALFFIVLWLFLCPVVIVMYYMSNLFARRLGHNVRPFPSDKLDIWLLRAKRYLVKQGLKRGILKRHRSAP